MGANVRRPHPAVTTSKSNAYGVTAMRGYLRDPARNIAHSPDAFPMADDTRVCRFCQYRVLCAPELAARSRAVLAPDGAHAW